MTITDDALDQALRASDPAAAPLTQHEQQAAEDHLLHLMSSESMTPAAVTPIRRRTAWRWLAPVAAAVTAGVALSWPHGEPGAAFASWTSQAKPASKAVAADAGKGCRASLAESLQHNAGQSVPTTATQYQQVVTEVRGPWVFTALAAKDGSAYNCLATATAPRDVLGAGGGIATAQSAPVPDLGTRGFITQDGSLFEDNHGAFTTAQGQLGTQVVAVTIHADGHDTTATVSDGYFAAWWPIAQGSTPGKPTYDLTLRNGQVLRNQKPLA